jgi:hypothetical protein
MTSLQHNVRLSKSASTLSKWHVGGTRNGTSSELCGRNAVRYCTRYASRSQLLLVNLKKNSGFLPPSGHHHSLCIVYRMSQCRSLVSLVKLFWLRNCSLVYGLVIFQTEFGVVKCTSSAMTTKAAAARSTSSPANTEQQALHGPMLCTDRAQPNEAPQSQMMLVRAFPVVDRRLAQASKCQWQSTGSCRRATTCHSLNVDGP